MGKRRHNSSDYSTAEKVLFQPWFLPQRVTFAIHSLVPPDFWNKMRNFFDDYGCMICEKDFDYHSNGMCKSCFDKTRKKLLMSVKRRLGRERHKRLDLELFRQEKLAKRLLKPFASSAGPRQRRSADIHRTANPVYEALVGRLHN